jgi:hypothetical protein
MIRLRTFFLFITATVAVKKKFPFFLSVTSVGVVL